MKSLLTTTILLGFISVAVFGFAGVSHGALDAHDDGCIMATAKGVECPQAKSAADYLTFHLNAFKSFSTATFGETLAASLLTLFLLALGLPAVALIGSTVPALSPAHIRHRWKTPFDFSKQRALLYWLALQEHSPTSL